MSRARARRSSGSASTCASMPGCAGGSVAAVLAQFSREGFAPFQEEWLRRHAWQGRRVALSQAERRVAEGRIVGVAEDGALMLSSAKGIERFHSGELSLKAL